MLSLGVEAGLTHVAMWTTAGRGLFLIYKVARPTLLEASLGNLLGEIFEGLDEDIKTVIMPFKVQSETASNSYVGREGWGV